MVAPFKPYVKSITRTFNAMHYETLGTYTKYSLHATGVEQRPPYVDTAYNCTVAETYYGPINAGDWNNWYQDLVDKVRVEATNLARAKFVGKLGDSSSWGATLLAERKATYGMLQGMIVTAWRSARAVRKGRLVEAATILGVRNPIVTRTKKVRVTNKKGKRVTKRIQETVIQLPTGRKVARTAGNGWLWWSYGIKPLMGDMHNSMDVLQRPLPWTHIQERGKSQDTLYEHTSRWHETYKTESKVSISADIRVVNPNLWLANQMGLVNPLQVINEGIMFSFVIDWFSNLSQVIQQMTDFVGLEIARPVTASRSSMEYIYVAPLTPPNSGSCHRKVTQFKRDLLIPKAKLVFKYERFQWQRGANAISLLVQFLKKG